MFGVRRSAYHLSNVLILLMMKMMRVVEVWVVRKFIVVSSCCSVSCCVSQLRLLVEVAVRSVDNFLTETYAQFVVLTLSWISSDLFTVSSRLFANTERTKYLTEQII